MKLKAFMTTLSGKILKVIRKTNNKLLKFRRDKDMTLEISNDYGKIDISNEVIASVVGGRAVECYGIVGMASRQQVRDGIAEILGHENYAKGIKVTENNGVVDIDMYIM